MPEKPRIRLGSMTTVPSSSTNKDAKFTLTLSSAGLGAPTIADSKPAPSLPGTLPVSQLEPTDQSPLPGPIQVEVV